VGWSAKQPGSQTRYPRSAHQIPPETGVKAQSTTSPPHQDLRTPAAWSHELAGARFQAYAATGIDRYAFNVTAAKGMAARYLGIDLAVTAEP
jgi:hypothetical protein